MAKPEEKPAEQPATEPEEKPAAEPAAKPEEKPAAEPEEKPAAEPAKKPEEKPAAEPAKKPAGKAEDDPFGQNDLQQLRLWTDASGKYQVEARFASFDGGSVRLQKVDGRYVRILLQELCQVDQRIVRQIESVATAR